MTTESLRKVVMSKFLKECKATDFAVPQNHPLLLYRLLRDAAGGSAPELLHHVAAEQELAQSVSGEMPVVAAPVLRCHHHDHQRHLPVHQGRSLRRCESCLFS